MNTNFSPGMKFVIIAGGCATLIAVGGTRFGGVAVAFLGVVLTYWVLRGSTTGTTAAAPTSHLRAVN